MTTPSTNTKSEKRRRQDRQFRIMFRPTGTLARAGPLSAMAPPPPPPPKRKVSRILALTLPPMTLVDDLCSRLVEKSSHWALVVLRGPYVPEEPRIPITADDPRIERVYEISRVRRDSPANEEEIGETDAEGEWLEGKVQHGESSSRGEKAKGNAKGIFRKDKVKGDEGKGTGWGIKRATKYARGNPETRRYERDPATDDSSEDDRHEDDVGFPEVNEKGRLLMMHVSKKPRWDFAELQCEYLGGPLWEILTGIEARTKFSNTELKHEAMRIWKRQQNYHLLDNNCQRFCILMAITIRAKNHSLLRVLHGQTVKEQIKGMKFEVGMKKNDKQTTSDKIWRYCNSLGCVCYRASW